MAIKSYANKAAYDAATKPTTESQVSLIENTNDVLIDGVNVITDVPQVADAVFLDESNKPVILKGGDSLVLLNTPQTTECFPLWEPCSERYTDKLRQLRPQYFPEVAIGLNIPLEHP